MSEYEANKALSQRQAERERIAAVLAPKRAAPKPADEQIRRELGFGLVSTTNRRK